MNEMTKKDIAAQLSKATNQELLGILMTCANALIDAEDENGYISGDGGIRTGIAIVEYIKRNDEKFKKEIEK